MQINSYTFNWNAIKNRNWPILAFHINTLYTIVVFLIHFLLTIVYFRFYRFHHCVRRRKFISYNLQQSFSCFSIQGCKNKTYAKVKNGSHRIISGAPERWEYILLHMWRPLCYCYKICVNDISSEYLYMCFYVYWRTHFSYNSFNPIHLNFGG